MRNKKDFEEDYKIFRDEVEKQVKNLTNDGENKLEPINFFEEAFPFSHPLLPEKNNFNNFFNDVDNITISHKYNQKSNFKRLFKITRENTKIFFINTKRGRYKKSIKKIKKVHLGRVHDHNGNDNIMIKIQRYYISFIRSFINNILPIFGFNISFLKLDPEFTTNVNKEYRESLKLKTIGEIISNKISDKYKYYNEDYNLLLYEKLKNNNIVLKKIFDENYLKLFRIYFDNKRVINLKEYGLDRDIILDKGIQMLDDLLDKKKDDEIYRNKIYDCIKTDFIAK